MTREEEWIKKQYELTDDLISEILANKTNKTLLLSKATFLLSGYLQYMSYVVDSAEKN